MEAHSVIRRAFEPLYSMPRTLILLNDERSVRSQYRLVVQGPRDLSGFLISAQLHNLLSQGQR